MYKTRKIYTAHTWCEWLLQVEDRSALGWPFFRQQTLSCKVTLCSMQTEREKKCVAQEVANCPFTSHCFLVISISSIFLGPSHWTHLQNKWPLIGHKNVFHVSLTHLVQASRNSACHCASDIVIYNWEHTLQWALLQCMLWARNCKARGFFQKEALIPRQCNCDKWAQNIRAAVVLRRTFTFSYITPKCRGILSDSAILQL